MDSIIRDGRPTYRLRGRRGGEEGLDDFGLYVVVLEDCGRLHISTTAVLKLRVVEDKD